MGSAVAMVTVAPSTETGQATYWRRYLGDSSFRMGGVEGSSSAERKAIPCWVARARSTSVGVAAPMATRASPRRTRSCAARVSASCRTSAEMARSRARIWPSRW